MTFRAAGRARGPDRRYTAGWPAARRPGRGRRPRHEPPPSRSPSPRRPPPRRTSAVGDTLAADRRRQRSDACATCSRARREGRGDGRRDVSRSPTPRTRTGTTTRRRSEAAVGGTVDNPIAYATGVIAPDGVCRRLRARPADRLSLAVLRRRGRQLDAGQLDALVPDLRRLKTEFEAAGWRPRRRSRTCGPGCAVVDRYLSERATAEAVLAVAALGPMAVAAGALGLIAILVIRRRRAAIVLARGRGASGGQLLWRTARRGPPRHDPGRAGRPGPRVGPRPGARERARHRSGPSSSPSSPRDPARSRRGRWRAAPGASSNATTRRSPAVSPRRLVFEALVIGLPSTGAWLLRERGLTGRGRRRWRRSRRFDPFLALSPVLSASPSRSDHDPALPVPGPRRSAGSPRAGATSSRCSGCATHRPRPDGRLPAAARADADRGDRHVPSVVRVTVDQGQVDDSWHQVGADYRIENRNGGTLDPDARPDGRCRASGRSPRATRSPRCRSATSRGRRRARCSLLAIEPGAYAAVIAGQPDATAAATSFAAAPTGRDAGTAADPIPAIVSSHPPTGEIRCSPTATSST